MSKWRRIDGEWTLVDLDEEYDGPYTPPLDPETDPDNYGPEDES